MTTDWTKVNAGRVKEGVMASRDSGGFNGYFLFRINGLRVKVIASDGSSDPKNPDYQWQHVSVSLVDSVFTPSWSIMCAVKEMFWGGDEWVVQFHPPRSAYVNNHPGCLHLWKPTAVPLPTPIPSLVGILGGDDLPPAEKFKIYREANERKS